MYTVYLTGIFHEQVIYIIYGNLTENKIYNDLYIHLYMYLVFKQTIRWGSSLGNRKMFVSYV